MTEMTITSVDVAFARQAIESPQVEEKLMRRLYPKIYQVSKFVTGNNPQVDDIAQLSALEVLKSLKNFNGTGSLEAWAGRITCRTAYRYLKHAKYKRSKVPLTAVDPDTLPANDTPEKSILRRQGIEKLLDKLTVIPEFRRTPLLLHLALGYTVSDIAYITGVSKNTVKGRLKTAFRELREITKSNSKFIGDTLEEMT